jgi:uncharacterized oligopeptide transporter (OPT) family protein
MSLRYILVFFASLVIFTKEYLLLDDSFVIIISSAFVFYKLVSASSGYVTSQINNINSTSSSEFAGIFKTEETLLKSHVQVVSNVGQSFQTVNDYVEDLCENTCKKQVV